MPMRKYTQSEGGLEIVPQEPIQEHLAKTGKARVSDFDQAERDALDADLSRLEDEGGPTTEDD